MITLNDAWVRAFSRDGVEPVYLVRIFLDPAGATEGVDFFTFATHHGFGYPASVADLRPFAFELDPVTRAFRVGATSVLFRDDGDRALREIMVNYRLRNKLVEIQLGAADLAVADFEPIARLMIANAPKPGGGPISLELVEPLMMLRELDLSGSEALQGTGGWINYHPLELVEELLVRGGLTDLYSTASLDPSNYTSSFSHWNLSRSNKQIPNVQLNTGLRGTANAFDMLQELLVVLGGSFLPNAAGVSSFQAYDPTAGVQRTWTEADVGASVKQEDTYGNIQNKLTVTFGRSEYYPVFQHTRRDDESVAAHATAGVTSGEIAGESIDTPWLNGIAYHRDVSGIPLGATSIIVRFAGIAGICGCHYLGNVHTRPAWAEPSASRPVYLKISRAGDPSSVPEIIRVEDIVQSGLTTVTADDAKTYLRDLEFVIAARGELGTTPTFWNPGEIQHVADITIPVELARRRLERFSNGCPVVTCRTSLRHMDLSVGDFVALVDPEIVGYKLDGSDAGDTWEIIKKQVDPLGDLPGIDWTLCYVPAEFSGSIADDSPPEVEPAPYGEA